jgi:hypothetical protein
MMRVARPVLTLRASSTFEESLRLKLRNVDRWPVFEIDPRLYATVQDEMAGRSLGTN